MSSTATQAASEIAPSTSGGDGLASRSFIALLITQFLGTVNDNTFRWLAVPIAKQVMGPSAALALGMACFTLPYLLLASPAGFLADRFSKRMVIVACKVAEIAIVLLALVALYFGSVLSLFGVVFLMGGQSALFAPSKYGAIPEILSRNKISKGNGWMGLTTVVSSALGCVAGNLLFTYIEPGLLYTIDPRDPTHKLFAAGQSLSVVLPVAALLVGVAVVGWASSLMVGRLSAADTSRALPKRPFTETWASLRQLAGNVPLLRAALGIAFFWFLASLANLNIDVFGNGDLGMQQKDIGILLGILVLGLGAGSVLAGFFSGDKVELGLVPLGACGVAIFSFLLYVTGTQFTSGGTITALQAFQLSGLWLFLLGVSAGLFDIPLEAFLQQRSPVKTRGTILAAGNFISFTLMLGSAGLFYALRDGLGLSASQIFLVAGLGTIPVMFYAFALLPQATIRFVVWLASHTAYRVRVYGRHNLPATGGALLVSNHVSWLDGIFLLMTSSRTIRMIAYADYVTHGPVGWLSRVFRVIPINASEGPKALLRSLQTAREAIINGELVCIFAEGEITRTGQLQPFQRGLMRIVEGTGAPVIPVYLDELWGSVFSYHGGKFFWKIPQRWPYPVSVTFGKPIENPNNVFQVRQAVQLLGVESVNNRKNREPVLPRLFIRKCRRSLLRWKVADSAGTQLTGGKLLAASIMFRRLLARQVLPPDEKMVGLLLPPSVGAVIANAAVTLLGRVAINLNYTLPSEHVNFCIRRAGIKHVLTSRRFLEKRPFDLDAEVVFLEDLKEQITGWDKVVALAQAYLCPAFISERVFGLTDIDPEDLMTVIFTSGSTGEPKGVMLTYNNIGSNVHGVDQTFHFDSNDAILGILPFFHSFGFTGTLWLVLGLDLKGVYHFNPLDARQIGKLVEHHKVTIMLSTPTFLRSYIKRCPKEQFKTLDLVVLGAEKMPIDVANDFEQKFGIRPAEGFGTTELSPVVAVNIPPHRAGSDAQAAMKEGTVGRPLPGITAKIVHPDTRVELCANQDGLLFIKGPNVMKGYLHEPEKTASVIEDGWYNTGDIARIDDQGFIQITGRLSRFSKIGGEMVPHIKLEEILSQIVGTQQQAETEEGLPEINLAVTAIPDEQKGERIVVLHRPLDKPVESVLKELANKGLPNLWIPSPDSFVEVEHVPMLGSGKLDLRGVKELAFEKFAVAKVEK